MTTDLDRLLAERAIRRRMLQYCTAIDSCDADLLRAVYHPDSTDDHGSFVGNGHDFVDAVIPALRDQWEHTQHTIGGSVFEWIDDDTVTAETNVQAQHVRTHREGGIDLRWFAGVYADRFERRDGKWRIAHREVLHTWDKRERAEAWYPAGTFRPRRRG